MKRANELMPGDIVTIPGRYICWGPEGANPAYLKRYYSVKVSRLLPIAERFRKDYTLVEVGGKGISRLILLPARLQLEKPQVSLPEFGTPSQRQQPTQHHNRSID